MFVKHTLLASTAGLCATVGAQAADLLVTKAAPVEYVRVCTAYGAGFFYIPGTDTCLRVGGRARLEFGYASQRSYGVYGATTLAPTTVQNTVVGGAVVPLTTGAAATLAAGMVPAATNFAPVGASMNDNLGTRGLGTLNLDARTQTAYGTLRAFVRFSIFYQDGQNHLRTGTVERYGTAFPGTGVDALNRAQTLVAADKAFIQFAGITAGRAASFFDFYAHDLELSARTVGSDVSSTNLLAYTATLGGGFSATASMEDPVFRRNVVFGTGGLSPFSGFVNPSATTLQPNTGVVNVLIANVRNVTPVGVTFDPVTGLPTVARFLDVEQRNRMPDFVANLRYDQPWGSVQLSGAIHEIALGQYDPNIDYRFLNAGGVTTGNVFLPGAFLTPFSANTAGLGLLSPFSTGNPAANTAILTTALSAATAHSIANAQNALLNAPQGRRPDAEYGWAIQGGLKLNLSMIAAGDLFYLQAAYSEGALSYTVGQGGIGAGIVTGSFTNQLSVNAVDAAVDAFGRMHLTKSFVALGALLHYWTPEIRQAFFGSYSKIDYDSILRTGFGPAGVFPLANVNGVTNFGNAYQLSVDPRLRDYHENLIGSNLIWSPVKSLDIGLEVFYRRITIDKGRVIDTNKNLPIGAISNVTGAPVTLGTPNSTAVYKTTNFDDQVVTRFRVQRDF